MAESRGMGIIRSADGSILFYLALFTGANAKIVAGATTLRIWRVVPTSGVIETYDFNDNAFKAGAITTPTVAMTYAPAENSTYDTGVWTYRHTTLTNFTVGDKYIGEISNASLDRPQQVTFQYGDLEGDEATLIPDFVWDEAAAGHVSAGTFGIALGVLSSIAARTNNPTLNALLGVPDVAAKHVVEQVWDSVAATYNTAGTMGALLNAAGGGASPGAIADAVWDELLSGHVTAGSAGVFLAAVATLVTLLQVGGTGDAAAILGHVKKIDTAATSVTPFAGSLADMIDNAIGNRQFLVAVSVNGTSLRVEVARELLGVIDTSPTTAQVQIFDEAGTLVKTITSGNFGAINARGWFGYTWASHTLLAGKIYQFAVTVDNPTQTTTKPVKILASA